MSNSLKDRALLVKFSRKAFGRIVQDKEEARAIDLKYGSKDGTRVQKQLFQKCPGIAPVYSVLGEAYLYHQKYTLPWMKGGVDLLPSTYYDEYIDNLGRSKNDLEDELRKVEPQYDQLVQDDMRRLKGLADNNDYPDFKTFKSKFSISAVLLPFPSSDDFRVSVSEDIKQEFDKFVAESSIQGREVLLDRVEKTVQRIVDQCSKEKTRIHESMLDNAIEMSEVMNILNVHDDEQVSKLSKDLYKLATTAITKDLRDSEGSRKQMVAASEKFLKQLRGEYTTETEDETEAEVQVEQDSVI